MKISNKIHDYIWAMSKEAFSSLLRFDDEIITSRFGGLSTIVSEGIGFVNVYGNIYPKENFMTYFGEGTALSTLEKDIIELKEKANVKAIVFSFDTNGGIVNGVADTAALIRSISKPTFAFVQTALSAGAWLAASTNKVVSTPTGLHGSIGVRLSVLKEDGESDIIEVVSEQSENKNLDPKSKAGKAELQYIANDLADTFISQMATYRSVSKNKVLNDFGKGGVVTAKDALKNKMIDSIETWPAFIDGLKNSVQTRKGFFAMNKEQETNVSAESQTIDVSALVNKERDRIRSIEGLADMFKNSPQSVQVKVKEEIDRLKFDENQTRETVSCSLLGISAKAQADFLANEQKERKETTDVVTTLAQKDTNDTSGSKPDLGNMLIQARKDRLNVN